MTAAWFTPGAWDKNLSRKAKFDDKPGMALDTYFWRIFDHSANRLNGRRASGPGQSLVRAVVFPLYLFLIVLVAPGFGQSSPDSPSLRIGPEDVRIEQSIEGGYYLYIQKTPGISSVLITESTEDPNKEVASYAYRNPEYHPENGDERRILDGEFLTTPGLYSLIDSTPVEDEQFGQAFRIFIPYIIVYGYPWTRNGEEQVLDGTYLSIRAFEKPYADYSGAFRDNPFRIRVAEQRPSEGPPEGNYMDDTVDRFTEVSQDTAGVTRYSLGEEDLVDTIREILEDQPSGPLELVFAIDTTQSMEDDMQAVRATLVSILAEQVERFDPLRIGFVLYRDYLEEYMVRLVRFRDGVDHVQATLDRIRTAGGRDIPEAVYEALHTAVTEFDWRTDNRRIVLIGDAPPHPRPRGRVTKELVVSEAESRGVVVDVIILPH
ncbi:vWA domain-containing protein [Spirochaeta lutea]|uniref:vWA domain-containing protein n=1 Tax=Spirochaeta lutea TaxID=1480694 RepID=UPI000B17AC20|nr:vWA domain-containing protein [Spirochaeta lutea]